MLKIRKYARIKVINKYEFVRDELAIKNFTVVAFSCAYIFY